MRKEISDRLNINYNTIRQISVLVNLLKQFSSYLNSEQISPLESLCNDIRALSPLKEDKVSTLC